MGLYPRRWFGDGRKKVNKKNIAGNSTVDNDTNGNPRKTVLNIKFDTEGPDGIHVLDGSSEGGKDLYFRIGDQNRDEGVVKDEYGEVIVDAQKNATAVSGAPAWDSGTAATDTTPAVPAKDKDVGGK